MHLITSSPPHSVADLRRAWTRLDAGTWEGIPRNVAVDVARASLSALSLQLQMFCNALKIKKVSLLSQKDMDAFLLQQSNPKRVILPPFSIERCKHPLTFQLLRDRCFYVSKTESIIAQVKFQAGFCGKWKGALEYPRFQNFLENLNTIIEDDDRVVKEHYVTFYHCTLLLAGVRAEELDQLEKWVAYSRQGLATIFVARFLQIVRLHPKDLCSALQPLLRSPILEEHHWICVAHLIGVKYGFPQDKQFFDSLHQVLEVVFDKAPAQMLNLLTSLENERFCERYVKQAAKLCPMQEVEASDLWKSVWNILRMKFSEALQANFLDQSIEQATILPCTHSMQKTLLLKAILDVKAYWANKRAFLLLILLSYQYRESHKGMLIQEYLKEAWQGEWLKDFCDFELNRYMMDMGSAVSCADVAWKYVQHFKGKDPEILDRLCDRLVQIDTEKQQTSFSKELDALLLQSVCKLSQFRGRAIAISFIAKIKNSILDKEAFIEGLQKGKVLPKHSNIRRIKKKIF